MIHKNNNKKIIAIALILLVIAGAILATWYYLRPKDQPKPAAEVTEETKRQAEQQDVEYAKSDANKNSNQGGSQQQSTSQSSSVSVNITSTGQNGSTVYVNALVSGTTSGTCKLTMSKNTKKVEKSAPIGFQVSYYICQGFNVSSSEFAEKGEWEAVVEAAGPNGTGKSEARKVNIQ